jgi:hypothetical protein
MASLGSIGSPAGDADSTASGSTPGTRIAVPVPSSVLAMVGLPLPTATVVLLAGMRAATMKRRARAATMKRR